MRTQKMAEYPDQTRNLNPTPEAVVAMIIWGAEYSNFGGGSMDFWDYIEGERKNRCHLVIQRLRPILSVERDND